MTTAIDTPQDQGFRLSQLIYDTRYRSITIQVIAMLAFMFIAAFLVRNTITNLANLGKEIDFGFLFNPANYDINQRLIEYDSTSTNLRAAMVGLLNTLLVAFMGCILATVVGVVAGVLRLSKNWLISKLMTVYVETFRNIPVVIWIIATMAVLSEALPQPRAFRGETPSASMWLWDSVAVTNRGTYIPAPVWGPGSVFVVLVFLLSLLAIWAFNRYAHRRFEATGQILPKFWINLAILFVPTLLVFFLLGRPIGLDLPALKGFNFQGGTMLRNPMLALWLALSFYTGAFIAEIVRSGILAISKGQSEAAFALGLRPSRTMNLVILPQALRVIIPPLISQFLNLTKNSSLALAVGYQDLRATLGGTTMNNTGRELECMLLMMLIYLVVSLFISSGMNIYNKSVKLKER
ncbi:amino acid ABC transporter permease [Celeribacter neptunius]|uniref:L-glutamine ABC transporter membrane protein /L-glutamate ABC transporter membrane protein /L-aspartate ABC transporter membrane protein /L-asparagine ABC transporter membrane protein n=1 Tax=Celeribacter neptunius TaxID=588602 RepID=A0A1I3RC04_9RHOB|nr:ABC transporter permease subunit [Celeribacter neptunius]SFJ44103.1 L-glutamine ABC transporter membrane protein /L-glutamate ABC transporter membrane protein /L-aspartate ABC transporter membrane protein /L-asparagine ABC transporter membrane protein [Celeribacter neptunius]